MFQLVYTEATLQQLNLSITAGERGGAIAMATGQTPSKESSGVARRKLQLSGGDGRDSDTEEESEEIVTAEELVQDYMTRVSLVSLSQTLTYSHAHPHTLIHNAYTQTHTHSYIL